MAEERVRSRAEINTLERKITEKNKMLEEGSQTRDSLRRKVREGRQKISVIGAHKTRVLGTNER
ncbi:hypothetical protein BJX76DRAFT_330079 [Aspergillus varians]